MNINNFVNVYPLDNWASFNKSMLSGFLKRKFVLNRHLPWIPSNLGGKWFTWLFLYKIVYSDCLFLDNMAAKFKSMKHGTFWKFILGQEILLTDALYRTGITFNRRGSAFNIDLIKYHLFLRIKYTWIQSMQWRKSSG